MKTVLFVLNPISGGSEKSEYSELVKLAAAKSNFSVIEYTTTGENDQKAIKELLKKNECSRVIAGGGDGTIKMVAECLLHYPQVSLGILPLGSSNGMARSLLIPNENLQALEIAFGRHSIEADLLQINDQYCIHLSDVGFNAQLVKNYEQGAGRGFFAYVKQLIPTLMDDCFLNFELKIDEQSYSHSGKMVVIGNARRYGFGGLINPEGSITDGRFDIVVIKGMGLPQIVKMMTDATEEEYNSENVSIYQGREAVISLQNPSHFQIDGEYLGEVEEVKVELAEEKVSIHVSEEATSEKSR